MKNLTKIIITIFFTVIFINSGHTTPIEYTFEGTINNRYYYDDLGLIEAAGLQPSSFVTYTFLVDFDQPAYKIIDGQYREYRNRFFTKQLSQSYLKMDDFNPTGFYFSGENPTIYKNHEEREYGYLTNTFVQWNPYESYSLQMFNNYNHVSDWQVGTAIRGRETVHYGQPQSAFYSDLTLTSINPLNNPTSQTPEPSTSILLFFGLLTFTGFNYRIKK